MIKRKFLHHTGMLGMGVMFLFLTAATPKKGMFYIGEQQEAPHECQDLMYIVPQKTFNPGKIRWMRAIMKELFIMDPTNSVSFSMEKVPGGEESLNLPTLQELLPDPLFQEWSGKPLLGLLHDYHHLFDQPTHGFEAQVADREKTRQQILAVLRSQLGLQTEAVNVPCDE